MSILTQPHRKRRTDWDMSNRTAVVYRAWDIDGLLLYVGCTVNFNSRMSMHRATSVWFPYAVRIEQDGPYPFDDARRREAEAIDAECPWFNGCRDDLVQVQHWRAVFHRTFQRMTGDHCPGYDRPDHPGSDTPSHPAAFWAARRAADEAYGPCQDAQWRHGCYLAHVEQMAVAS